MANSKPVLKLLSEMMADPRFERYGAGYFQNVPKRRIVPLDYGDLGPHGDHDGWISLGNHAEQLGLDPHRAKAFQEAHFGNYGADEPPPNIKDLYDRGTFGAYGESMPELADYFFQKYGMGMDEAADQQWPDLLRYRLWPDRLLTVTGDEMDDQAKIARAVRDFSDQVQLTPENTKKLSVYAESPSGKPIRKEVSGPELYDPNELMKALLSKYATGGMVGY